MITLTGDDAALEKLRQVTDLVEVHDANGRVVGYFAPVSAERAHLYNPPTETKGAKEPSATTPVQRTEGT